MMDSPSRGELGGTVSTTLANLTKKWIKMSEHTSTTSRMHGVTSTGAISLAMKRKYIGAKNTSKSSVIQTQPSNHSTPATLQIPMAMIPKGPEHS